MATTIFDYIQVFTWPDGETVPGSGEISSEDLGGDVSISHVSPEVFFISVDPVITGDEIIIVEHTASEAVFYSESAIEYDGILIITHVPPAASFSSDTTATVITSVDHVPPVIDFEGADIQLMVMAMHVPPDVSFTAELSVEYDGILIIQHEPAVGVFSHPAISASLGVVPTWFTGQLVTHVPPVIVFTVPENAIGSILDHISPVITITAPDTTCLLISAETPIATVYKCVLTGSPDLVLPISSFQARIRNGVPTYLEVVVPNASIYADDIADRTTGDIVVSKGASLFPDGTINYAEIARADFDSLQIDQGGTAYTIRLSGHQTTTYASPATRALTDISTVSQQVDGKRRVRCGVNFLVRPGDTVTWNGGDDSMTAGMITLTVSVLQQIMDITEA